MPTSTVWSWRSRPCGPKWDCRSRATRRPQNSAPSPQAGVCRTHASAHGRWSGVAAEPNLRACARCPCGPTLIFLGGLGWACQLRLNVDGFAALGGELGIVGLELGALARKDRLTVAPFVGAAIKGCRQLLRRRRHGRWLLSHQGILEPGDGDLDRAGEALAIHGLLGRAHLVAALRTNVAAFHGFRELVLFVRSFKRWRRVAGHRSTGGQEREHCQKGEAAEHGRRAT